MQEDATTLNQLNEAWHDAYRQRKRAALREILAEDFLAFLPNGESVDRETLIAAEPPELNIESTFSEFALHLFGETALTRGRVDLVVDGEPVQQRFMRVWAKRKGRWWAVAVQVFSVDE